MFAVFERVELRAEPSFGSGNAYGGIRSEVSDGARRLGHPSPEDARPLRYPIEDFSTDPQRGGDGVGHTPFAVAGGEVDVPAAPRQLADKRDPAVRFVVLGGPGVA